MGLGAWTTASTEAVAVLKKLGDEGGGLIMLVLDGEVDISRGGPRLGLGGCCAAMDDVSGCIEETIDGA